MRLYSAVEVLYGKYWAFESWSINFAKYAFIAPKWMCFYMV